MNRLRVLQIEDSESDAALIVRLLEKSGYEVDSVRVEDEQGLRAAIEGHTWDVIISDYRLPSFDIRKALQVMREAEEDIPFVIVSGSIGEAAAVDLMKSGAHDYVMKGNMSRLVPAVEREVREAQARRERRQAEERLALAVSATQLGTFDYYPQSGELIWSDISKQQFGLPADAEVTYDQFLGLIQSDDREHVDRLVRRALQTKAGGQFAAEFRTKGAGRGDERSLSARGQAFFDSHGRAIRLIGVTIDGTERKRLEDQFRQSQKLESIGRLAGGVAHDFNNLLTIISGYVEMILDELTVSDPIRESLEEINNAASRATALTRQLLTFSRRQVSEPRNLLLNDLVRDFEKMLRRLIGDNIDLRLSLDPEAGVVRADPGQIEQVIMNLVVNARDAMPGGGKLLVETAVQTVEVEFANEQFPLSPGAYVTLMVSDNGTGMTPEVKAHLFEPFFTTKSVGKGTGLGLSTVYGIVKQSKGAISVYSEPGRGTTIKILLPANDASPEPVVPEDPNPALAGSGTILVVEDEPGVREFLRRTLTRHGYSVMTAPNGHKALASLRQNSQRVDLLLADISMPEMGGIELSERFGAEFPGVPVLLMSGYAEGLLDESSRQRHMQKPFTAGTLLKRVRAVLGPDSEPGPDTAG